MSESLTSTTITDALVTVAAVNAPVAPATPEQGPAEYTPERLDALIENIDWEDPAIEELFRAPLKYPLASWEIGAPTTIDGMPYIEWLAKWLQKLKVPSMRRQEYRDLANKHLQIKNWLDNESRQSDRPDLPVEIWRSYKKYWMHRHPTDMKKVRAEMSERFNEERTAYIKFTTYGHAIFLRSDASSRRLGDELEARHLIAEKEWEVTAAALYAADKEVDRVLGECRRERHAIFKAILDRKAWEMEQRRQQRREQRRAARESESA